ncbi:hypothetical protein [Amycolatopsis thermoflava]|uniref:hypothetical protein n=1 Tax=Amycolatopsis thermoflava TaxID=84480 RepID=UPI0026BEE76A
MTLALRDTLWTRARPVERVAYVVAAALFASGLVHLVVLVASGTTWEGPLSYRKAMTFGLSFGLTLASVTWATGSWRSGGGTSCSARSPR